MKKEIRQDLYTQSEYAKKIGVSQPRVAQMMKILEVKGYDMSKIYNVGGVGQYTDSKYAPYLTNTGEFTVEATYIVTELTRK